MKTDNPELSDNFLYELFFTGLNDDRLCGIVCGNLHSEDLPKPSFQKLLREMKRYYGEHGVSPTFNVMCQIVSSDKQCKRLMGDIESSAEHADDKDIIMLLEKYLKNTRFIRAYKESGSLYSAGDMDGARSKMESYIKWETEFSLAPSEFVNVLEDIKKRHDENRKAREDNASLPPITHFHIGQLDEMNSGRDLRGQLTCWLASTGVGKSHAARWIGKSACMYDGLNVLHIQLEGSEKEVVDAYSASVIGCAAHEYGIGVVGDRRCEAAEKSVSSIKGALKVCAFSKFSSSITTSDVKNLIDEFRTENKASPDVVVIDSMDLLTDSSGRKWSESGERYKRIKVANDLKDIATEENVWMVVTYQATIENREWLDDENNVLTEYNCAEAKGLSRPMTHIITLNQSRKEAKDQMMRLYVAKSRFFKRGEPFRIATDYDHERFYDEARTSNMSAT